MQKPQMNLIRNALGCLVILSLISGCATQPSPQVIVKTVTVTKPKPIVPPIDQVQLRPLNWTVITPQNASQEFAKQNTKTPFLMALNPQDYQNYALNQTDIIMLLSQYKKIVSIYANQ